MKLWTFLTTDIRELNLKRAEEQIKTGTDAFKAVFELAKAAQEQGSKVDALKGFVGEISSLLDVLNSPLGHLVKDTIPFAPIAITILKLIGESTKREPTLEQCMMLVSQTAYLESVRSHLKRYANVLDAKAQTAASEQTARQLKALAEQDFTSQDAQNALLNFPNSKLAVEFNAILKARLQDTGFTASQATSVTQGIAWDTPRFINQAMADHAETLKPLAELHRNGGREVLERYHSRETYLNTYIRPLPDQVIFQEETTSATDLRVTYKDLYVPLKGQPLDCDGKIVKTKAPLELAAWITQILQDGQKAKHLMFIQGEAGRGKSVFCRMFAQQVYLSWYPSYIPVLIRLRGLRSLTNRLQDTLESSPELQTCDFVTSDPGWLTDSTIRFLFLLDGFDELLLEGRSTGGLQEFLQQVEQFQQGSHHRFVITGRPLALMQVEKLISQTRNIERIELQPMDNDLTQAWLTKWAGKAGKAQTQEFLQFLQACPKDVQTLVREPLLMYLMARMHREQPPNQEQFAEAKGMQAKIQVYDAAISWVLEKQRQTENIRLTGLETGELRQFLTEVATCVVQSGNEVAKVSMLEARLTANHNPAAQLVAKARQETQLSDSRALNNLMASFYLKPASGQTGGNIEFVHKSFGEFLFAERLLETLADCTEAAKRRGFRLSDANLHAELYDLLGYGGLTPEIVSYLTPRLVTQVPEADLITLFNRLNDFYERWCEGEFIDAPPENLPQRKMRVLKECLPEQKKPLGIRQVDVYAGLNVMILLLELHRYAQDRENLNKQIVFYPSGKPVGDEPITRLREIISYSECVGLGGFRAIVRSFLSSANLSFANLSRADLSSANLSSANLSSADLSSADLISADLSSANLISADLSSADLISADLSSANLSSANLISADLIGTYLISANLSNANLRSADLSYAYLSSANLTNANLSFADLEDIAWNTETNWEGVTGLETAKNVPIALKQQLGLE
jgi:Pentapeptide repeats (8 copies)/NACHT domain